MWYSLLKSAEEYASSNTYGYWILNDGTLLPVDVGTGHIGALKPFGMSTNTEAFRKNMIRLVTENNELWVQFEYLKPNSAQKSTLVDMAKNWNFTHFIVEANYLPDERYEYQNSLNFIRLINSIQ